MNIFKKKQKVEQMSFDFPQHKPDKLLKMQDVKSMGMGTRIRRGKVPGGWLVAIENMSGLGMTFYPDPNHEWDGKTLK